jgi:hypothetical protein
MYELGLLVTFAVAGAVWYAIAQWWLEARTTWLSRLSARGIVRGRYTPWSAEGWGGWGLSPRWLLKQRPAPSDVITTEKLAHSEDADRTTELWRVRTLRRGRLLWMTAPAVLIAPFLAGALLNRYEATFVVVVIALVLVLAYPARALYQRVREWGDHDDADTDVA